MTAAISPEDQYTNGLCAIMHDLTLTPRLFDREITHYLDVLTFKLT